MNADVARHLDFLKKSVYHTEGKWPQFRVLFQALERWLATNPSGKRVLVLERAYFFGGHSLYGPLFADHHCTVVDCVNDSLAQRTGHQSSVVDHPDFIRMRAHHAADPGRLDFLPDASFDLVFPPNIVHHIRDQKGMFDQWARLLAPGGELMVFEGLVRELHHVPDDYLRYTPYGFQEELTRRGLQWEGAELGSGVFDVIAYAWQMALENFPEGEREQRSRWFFQEEFPRLMELERRYPKNLQKPDKAFPMSYVVRARRPQGA